MLSIAREDNRRTDLCSPEHSRGVPLESLPYQLFHREPAPSRLIGHHLFHILRNQIGFEIHGVAGLERVEIRHLDGMGNDGNCTIPSFEVRNRETDALNADGALVDGVFLNSSWQLDSQREIFRIGDALQCNELSHAIYMALYDVSAEAAICFHRQLQVDQRAIMNARERCEPPGFGSQISAEGARLDIECGKANATDGDAVAGLQLLCCIFSCNRDAAILATLFDAGDASYFFNDASKHEASDDVTKQS